jgi:carotenoid phi-ring synthase / carotenoid chi-ring synthase
MQLPRRDFLKAISVAAGAGSIGTGCASATGSDFDVTASQAAQNSALPDNKFDPDLILPFYQDDPTRLPVGKRRSVLVVGGGLAGLSAALELAERGYDVSVREAAPQLGGRLATRTEKLRTGTFKVEHGLHMWFHHYYNSFDVFERLGLNNFQKFEQVHFQFRTYKPETLESKGPYPLNLIGIMNRSPNMNLLNAIKTFGAVPDIIFYDHATNTQRFDAEKFVQWGKRTNVDQAFWDIIMAPAASVTLNDPSKVSVAEMLTLMHLYFIGHPRAFNRVVTTQDHGTSVIEPWAAKVRSLGGKITTGAPVAGLQFTGDRVVGEVEGSAAAATSYDHVVLATDIPGLKRVLAGSKATDAQGGEKLDNIRAMTGKLAIAPAYSVLRVWFDKPTAPRPFSQAVIESSQFRPINLVALFHMLERESMDWAKRTGGSVVEFHLYNTPEFKGLGADQVWQAIRAVALEVLPDLAGATPLDFSLGSYENFTSMEVGQGIIRPSANAPKLELGIQNLAFAGDWVRTLFPSALMEKAVATGREAANHILRSDRVREATLRVAKSNGPGIIPKF